MDSRLEQAREWAERVGKIEGLMPGPRAGVEVIQSLPDQIVDGDKLREVIADWGNREVTSDAYTLYRQVLALLPTPPRPEDVPEGEPWIVENHGFRWVGTREAEGNGPCMWALARLDSKFVDLVFDEHVTLISRLVPERKENA